MTTTHWGEIPNIPNESPPDVNADIELAMDQCCLAQFEDEELYLTNENISLPQTDPLMMYAISLHKYANDMTEMIRIAELATETNLIPPEDAAPPMPKMPEMEMLHKRNNLNFIPKDFTNFSMGRDVEVPELNGTVSKQILSKCVAIMFAHIGYETTHQSILDILTDVLETFFSKFCHKLKVAVDDEERLGACGFPNPIERVLTEIGMGGVKGLHDYYQCRVLKYINVLQKRCGDLNDYYAELLLPTNTSPDDKMNKVIRRKVEEDDDDVIEVDNPNVHFTAIDGELCSTFETGYQLLNTFEAETSLQNFGETSGEI